MSYTYKYPKPSVTVDCVVFGLDDAQKLKVLLIQRGIAPYQNKWALPGGFIGLDESIATAAARELKEETGIDKVFLEQLYTFGEVDRDPRDRIITVAYYALINIGEYVVKARTDAKNAKWFSVEELPPLAFDHDRIFSVAKERLKGKLRYQPIGFELLPSKFTLTQLQRLYETVLEQKLDKRNFRSKILKMKLLVDLEEMQAGVSHRPAKLYQFDKKRYQELEQKEFNFEI
ncbi:NUDIX hydrolase [Waterburya agarophytonicola K14]|uniref:NUDIX hydrolase n=1 Tax=Waterburya agarophytonicola KI4 TaxID=2874699 RepID=A0A964BSP3_9CYAN|nr:NUDIX domain-containing protein [Waterburya agarophytonicola]MCC0179044.1 NUDIX hydrolase [Waterburya agarophytonicola KI4]